MAKNSGISWTNNTWNFITGCKKVTAGCDNCYAELMANRLKLMGAARYQFGFEPAVHFGVLWEPLKEKKPSRYFVNSMADAFHRDVPWDVLDAMMEVIKLTPWHSYQLLTKRPQIMLQYFRSYTGWDQRTGLVKRGLPPNLWIGVTVENQEAAWRVKLLQQVPGDPAVKFLSMEPLIGPVKDLNYSGIDWVIIGGESGFPSKIRKMEQDWAERILWEAHRTYTEPFHRQTKVFFKQTGTLLARELGIENKGETLADVPITLQVQEYPISYNPNIWPPFADALDEARQMFDGYAALKFILDVALLENLKGIHWQLPDPQDAQEGQTPLALRQASLAAVCKRAGVKLDPELEKSI